MRGSERREHPRVRRSDKTVKILSGGRSALARVETLSADGLSITSAMDVAVGERLDLFIELARRPIVLSATVIRTEVRGDERVMALRFVDLPEGVMQFLARWVQGASTGSERTPYPRS